MKYNRVPIYFWLNLLFLPHAMGQWQWISPTPTGNDLYDVRFLNANRGWMVGTNGTLFATTNGGMLWKEIDFDPRYSLNSLFVLDDQDLWVTTGLLGYYPNGTNFSILHSSDGGFHWTQQVDQSTFSSDSLPLQGASLWDICFLNAASGWAVGDSGVLLHTSNGGSEWHIQRRFGGHSLRRVRFLNDSVGFIAGGIFSTLGIHPQPSPLSVSRGIIMRTTDAGANWDTLYADTIEINAVHFQDNRHGWAIGTSAWYDSFSEANERNFVLKTSDGGTTWQTAFWNIGASSEDIFFTDTLHGWIVDPGGGVASTTDGGQVWPTYSSPSPRFIGRLHRIRFIDSLHGRILGSDGAILQTTDGGQSWLEYDQKPFSIGINDVLFVSPDTGWVAVPDLYRTTDGGQSWNSSGVTDIVTTCSVDRWHSWACGTGGRILFSSDAGASWTQQTTPTMDDLRKIGFATSTIGWAFSGLTTFLKTTNGGQTWGSFPIPNVGVGQFKPIIQDTIHVWIFGGSGSIYTTDGGASWLTIDPQALVPLFFLNADTGWGWWGDSVHRNILYRTFDGGNSWDSVGMRPISLLLSYCDVNHGLSQLTGSIQTTTDGGQTWQTGIYVDALHGLFNSCLIDSTHGWATGIGGTIIRYGYPEKITSVLPDKTPMPMGFRLEQNYPNPFNPVTVINYGILHHTGVQLRVFNVLGELVETLVDEQKGPGNYAARWNASRLSSGVYFYKIIAGNFVQTRKMVLIK